VKDCRKIGKKDMKYNDSMPKMKVDPERYVGFHSFWFLLFGRSFGRSFGGIMADEYRLWRRMGCFVKQSLRLACH
jgi:hypothetical protein